VWIILSGEGSPIDLNFQEAIMKDTRNDTAVGLFMEYKAQADLFYQDLEEKIDAILKNEQEMMKALIAHGNVKSHTGSPITHSTEEEAQTNFRTVWCILEQGDTGFEAGRKIDGNFQIELDGATRKYIGDNHFLFFFGYLFSSISRKIRGDFLELKGFDISGRAMELGDKYVEYQRLVADYEITIKERFLSVFKTYEYAQSQAPTVVSLAEDVTGDAEESQEGGKQKLKKLLGWPIVASSFLALSAGLAAFIPNVGISALLDLDISIKVMSTVGIFLIGPVIELMRLVYNSLQPSSTQKLLGAQDSLDVGPLLPPALLENGVPFSSQNLRLLEPPSADGVKEEGEAAPALVGGLQH
jgi:hypothetical protein